MGEQLVRRDIDGFLYSGWVRCAGTIGARQNTVIPYLTQFGAVLLLAMYDESN